MGAECTARPCAPRRTRSRIRRTWWRKDWFEPGKVQQVVESTQKEFQQSQTQLLDIKRSYETALGTVWQGFWLGMAGYPKIDLSKIKMITTDGHLRRPATDSLADRFRFLNDACIYLRTLHNRARLCAVTIA